MSRFDPYANNGGTSLAIASSDFAIIAADTRQTEGYSIQTRYATKLYPLTDTTIMTVVGFQADGMHLVKRVKQRLEWYYHTHGSLPSIQGIARLVQTMLYGKRFFPFYTYVILAGMHPDGAGAVYSFDPVGSYERTNCIAYGAASGLIQPFLDNLVYKKNQANATEEPLKLEEAQELIIDTFNGVTERHIEVGDELELIILRKGQPLERVTRPLKRD